MVVTGSWLVIQRIVITSLYKLLRLVFITVQSIFWQLNGTARKIREARLPDNYERSAQVLDVLLVHQFCDNEPPTMDNYLCTHNRFEHPQYIIDNESITLMIINERHAVFGEPDEKGKQAHCTLPTTGPALTNPPEVIDPVKKLLSQDGRH